MDILPNKLKRKLKTPRTPRKTAKFDRLVTNLENEVNLPKDPVDLPMREDHELPMVDNNNEDNFIPILVHDEMDNKPTAVDPPLENKPTAVDPPLENKPTAVDPPLENKPTAVDPPLENKPTAVDPPLENKPYADDAYAVWDDPMDIDEDKKPEDKIHAVIVDNYEEPSNDEKE
ncbi:hypothetical protein TNCT_367841, partial [Trichonephila clavata]